METPRKRCLTQRFSSPLAQSRHWPQPIQGNTACFFPISSFGDVGTDFVDDAGDLVAERERQRHAARGVEPLAAAEIGIAVLDVQVGMAEPAAFDADQHFAALRLRRVDDGFAQRRIELDQRLATHQRHGISPLSRLLQSV